MRRSALVVTLAVLALAAAAHAAPPGLETRATTGATAEPVVHFTFDDGPDPATTPALLDALDRHHIRATFFLLGDRLARPGGADVAREIVRRGHEIAAHGFHHVALGRLPRADAVRALDDTQHAFEAAGLTPRLFRPPYGNTTARVDAAITAHGWQLALWALNPADYAATSAADAVHTFDRQLARQERAGVHGGLVLMHDTHPFIVEELDGVLDVLRRRSCDALRQGRAPYEIATDARVLLDATSPPGAHIDVLVTPQGCGR